MKLNLRSQEFQEYSLKSTHIATFVQPSEGPQNIHGHSYESRSTGGSQNKGAHAQ